MAFISVVIDCSDDFSVLQDIENSRDIDDSVSGVGDFCWAQHTLKQPTLINLRLILLFHYLRRVKFGITKTNGE